MDPIVLIHSGSKESAKQSLGDKNTTILACTIERRPITPKTEGGC